MSIQDARYDFEHIFLESFYFEDPQYVMNLLRLPNDFILIEKFNYHDVGYSFRDSLSGFICKTTFYEFMPGVFKLEPILPLPLNIGECIKIIFMCDFELKHPVLAKVEVGYKRVALFYSIARGTRRDYGEFPLSLEEQEEQLKRLYKYSLEFRKQITL